MSQQPPLSFFERTFPPERRRFIRFATVGASGVLVNLGFLALGLWLFEGLEAGKRESAASMLGIGVSILSNFFLNDIWTWGDRAKGSTAGDFTRRLLSFFLSAGFAALVQFGIATLLREQLAFHVYVAQAAGIAVGTIINYVLSNRVVFKDKA